MTIQSNQDRKLLFLPLNQWEVVYKELFRNQPDVYFFKKENQRFHNWEEFVQIYKEKVKEGIEIPDLPPTFMAEQLPEKGWFYESDIDVSLILNVRYCPPFWHHLKFIKIVYVLNGECLFYIKDDKALSIKAGNFVIVPPNIEQTVFSHHDEDIVVNILIRSSTFEKAFSSLLMKSEELAVFFWKMLYGKDVSSIVWFRCNSDANLDRFVLDMFKETENHSSNWNFLLISHVMLFLAYALCHYQNDMVSLQESRLKTEQLPVIIQYIRENYNTVTLSSLAEHFHKSEGYLCRYIKQETGYSLTHLLKKFRIKQAALMLRDTECSVEKIMLNVGYTDISYFYKTFKEHYGMTPSVYRKQVKIICL